MQQEQGGGGTNIWDVDVWEVLQWFKFEEIKNQTSSKRTCIRSVPACACACAGGRRALRGIEGRHVYPVIAGVKDSTVETRFTIT